MSAACQTNLQPVRRARSPTVHTAPKIVSTVKLSGWTAAGRSALASDGARGDAHRFDHVVGDLRVKVFMAWHLIEQHAVLLQVAADR